MALALILLVFCFSGCWNRREPEELALVTAIAFHRDEETGDPVVIVKISNPRAENPIIDDGDGGNNRERFWIISTGGCTVFDAFKNLATSSNRIINLTHTSVVLFSEELAREGIELVLDFISRERQLRLSATPVVVEGDIRRALETELPLEEIGGRTIARLLEASQEERSVSRGITLLEMYNDLNNPGWELTLPRLQVAEEEEGTVSEEDPLKVSGMAAFHKGRQVGWLNEQEARSKLWLKNDIRRVTYVLEGPSEPSKNVTVEIFQAFSDVEARVEDGEVVITAHIRAIGRVQEATIGEEWFEFQTEYSDSLERRLAQAIRNDLEAGLHKVQKELKSDNLGLGYILYRTKFREWQKIEHDWEQIFPSVQVEVNVDASVVRTGLIKDPLTIR